MKTHYLETRGRTHDLPASIAADNMRHWHARLGLGKGVVVCDDPEAFMALCLKQWHKLSRDLQRRRESAPDAGQILRFTRTITRMQHLRFVALPPHEQPDAELYFVRPSQLRLLPANCFSIYLATLVPSVQLNRLVAELPPQALFVDYCDQLEVGSHGLRPKAELEFQVRASWLEVTEFLAHQGIVVPTLTEPVDEARDEALDALLETGPDFLHLASKFQHTIDLARPLLAISKTERGEYEALAHLAYQVQALTQSGPQYDFLGASTDDSFFLHDLQLAPEHLPEAVSRHYRAGRWNLARALMRQTAAPAAILAAA